MGKECKKYEFNMPDGSILTTCSEVDRYYNLGKNVTRQRLKIGWTEEECANNKRVNGYKKHVYEFHMPNGVVVHSYTQVDRYYNLKSNTTRSIQRLSLKCRMVI